MGLVHSMVQSTVFCIERSLTCMFAACFVILMLLVILCIMVYGTSIGYHYNQKELAALSVRLYHMNRKAGTRRNEEEYRSQEAQPYVPSVLRVLPVNRSLDSMEELINRAVTMKELAPATAPTPGVVYERPESRGMPYRPEEAVLGNSVRRRMERAIKNMTKFH